MKRTHVMVHHSLTKDRETVSWGAIRKYHMGALGYADIGYHAGIELQGDHLEALYGRPETERAAACKHGDMNGLALHVCFVGNFDLEPPSDELLAFGARIVIRPWLVRLGLGPADVIGHRDFATYKSCPGDRFDLERLRAML